MVTVASAGWVVLGGSAERHKCIKGQTGFVNNVGSFSGLLVWSFGIFLLSLRAGNYGRSSL